MSGSTCSGTMGISADLRCELPATNMVALYGLPAFYAGERGSLELAARFSRVSSAFVDIGAHLGYFSFFVHYHGAAGVPIHFFEPDRQLFAALDRNVRANRLDRIQGYARAVGARDGLEQFFVNATDPLSGSLRTQFAPTHQVSAIDVEVESFATIARRLDLRQACVKVDVEGAEFEFLEGATNALDRIGSLIIEVLGPACERGFVPALMQRGGFHAYYINDYVLEHSADGSFTYRAPEYNWLFCRHAPEELSRLIGAGPLTVRA